MTNLIQSIFSFLASLCAAVSIYSLSGWLVNHPPSITRSLQDYAFSPPNTEGTVVPIGSMVHQIRLAFAGFSLDVSGRERFSYYLSIGILGLGLALAAAAFNLPPLFWLAEPAIAYFAINSLVNRKWNNVRTAMEQEIPSYMKSLYPIWSRNFPL